MLAILDPVLFDPDRPLTPRTLNHVIRVARAGRARIPNEGRYWPAVEKELIRPMSRIPALKQGLDALRSLAQPVSFPTVHGKVPVWSFRQMFGLLDDRWVEIMEKVIAGAVLTGEQTILVTCLREGRNVQILQGPGECRLREKTCWNLRVQPSGHALSRIPAVCRERNLRVPWTCRYDDRLPASDDRADFPFYPSRNWEKESECVVFTHKSRPTWRDDNGNHWARPAAGDGHHWDVYLTDALEQDYGLGQLNIVEWGAPRDEGLVGSLHHVPKAKRGKLRKQTGWRR